MLGEADRHSAAFRADLAGMGFARVMAAGAPSWLHPGLRVTVAQVSPTHWRVSRDDPQFLRHVRASRRTPAAAYADAIGQIRAALREIS